VVDWISVEAPNKRMALGMAANDHDRHQ